MFPKREERSEVVEHTGKGDPLQSISLLWRTTTKTGRSGLTLDAVIDAGIALAGETGIDNLSMRKIADRLGVGTMSLYAHVPGKAELIDLMVDRVNGEAYEVPDAIPANGTWREAIEAIAERNWQLLSQHRWLLSVDEARPALGPGTITKYDTELRPLDGIGLDDIEIDQVLTLVLQHVRSMARLSSGISETAQTTGRTDGEWWRVAGPVLAALVGPQRFPYASRIGDAAGRQYDGATDPESAYAFGLRTVLDGVEDLIHRKAAQE